MVESLVKVAVINSSSSIRDLLVAVLGASPRLRVIAMGADAEDAVRLAKRMRPDVLVMEGQRRAGSGLEATRRIMRETPTRIVIVTDDAVVGDLDGSFEALKAGALTVVRTPARGDLAACEQLAETVQLMADVPVVHHWGRADTGAMARHASRARSANLVHTDREAGGAAAATALPANVEVVGVASSTGGPVALGAVLGGLGPTYPVPILVVQHITVGFGRGLANWLQSQIRLRVLVAEDGQALEPGVVLVAPDDHHMQVSMAARVVLTRTPHYKGLRPSANVLFRSLASVYGARAMGIILTGMGDDGVEGLGALHQAGGIVIAQDAATSAVYGMPREAVARGVVDKVLALDEIALALASIRRTQQVGVA